MIIYLYNRLTQRQKNMFFQCIYRPKSQSEGTPIINQLTIHFSNLKSRADI